MKILICGLAALVTTTAAVAQTSPSSGAPTSTSPMAGSSMPGSSTSGTPMGPSATTPSTSGTSMPNSTDTSTRDRNTATTLTDPMTGSSSAQGSANIATGTQLTQKNGTWWNGDRRATQAEINQYRANTPR